MTNQALTESSKSLFLKFIMDAPNWNGIPMFEGTKAEQGNLSDLKKKGLIVTDQDCDNRQIQWVYFTKAGKQLAAQLVSVEAADHLTLTMREA